MNFLDKAQASDPSTWSDLIADAVAEWHEMPEDNQEINEFLGISESGYLQWVSRPEILEYIVKAELWGRKASVLKERVDDQNY